MKSKALPKMLSKNLFWIAMGAILVTGLGIWGWTAYQTSQQFAANTANIKAEEAKLTSIIGHANHPNTVSQEKTEVILEGLKTSVRDAWKQQYDSQSNLFLWPADIAVKDQRLRQFRPIEKTVNPTDPAYEVQNSDFARVRGDYATFISEEFPRLAKIIGAKWKVNTTGASTSLGSGGYGGTLGGSPDGSMSSGGSAPNTSKTVEEPEVVNWAVTDQTALFNRFNFSQEPQARPGLADMLYAQEDLWVLQAVLNVIKRTNGDADAAYEAVIKELLGVHLGQEAGLPQGKVERVKIASAAGGGYGDYGSPDAGGGYGSSSSYGQSSGSSPDMPSSGGTPGMPGSSGSSGTGTVAVKDPAQFRYVTNDYKPLSGEELRSSMTAGSSETAYLAVAKRMPIRLQVKIDQRYLAKLLAECANSPLPIEIRQVRIVDAAKLSPRTAAASSGGGYGSSYGASSGGSSAASGISGYGAGSPDASMSSGSSSSSYGAGYGGYGLGGSTAVEGNSGFDKVVELYGVIYIYNPPDTTILDEVTLDAPAGTMATPGTPTAPISTPAAPATPTGPTSATPETAIPPDAVTPTEPGVPVAPPVTPGPPVTPPAGDASTTPPASGVPG